MNNALNLGGLLGNAVTGQGFYAGAIANMEQQTAQNLAWSQAARQQQAIQALDAMQTANQNQQINNVQAQQDRDTKAQAFKQNMATEAMTAQMKEAETTQRTLHEQRQTALDKIEQRLSK